MKETYKIWFRQFDANGALVGIGRHNKEYRYRTNAIRFAKKFYDNPEPPKYQFRRIRIEWVVSQTNPWASTV